MEKERLQEILLTARNKKRLTQEEVVLLSEEPITRQYYGMIENGGRKPSVKIAKSISKVLEVDWTIFFENECNFSFRSKEAN